MWLNIGPHEIDQLRADHVIQPNSCEREMETRGAADEGLQRGRSIVVTKPDWRLQICDSLTVL